MHRSKLIFEADDHRDLLDVSAIALSMYINYLRASLIGLDGEDYEQLQNRIEELDNANEILNRDL